MIDEILEATHRFVKDAFKHGPPDEGTFFSDDGNQVIHVVEFWTGESLLHIAEKNLTELDQGSMPDKEQFGPSLAYRERIYSSRWIYSPTPQRQNFLNTLSTTGPGKFTIVLDGNNAAPSSCLRFSTTNQDNIRSLDNY
jgi:hypothetical protein